MSPPRRPRGNEPPEKLTRATLKKALRESAAYSRRALALVWQSSKPLTVALAVLTLRVAAVPPAVAFAGKRIVDSVLERSREDTMKWVGVELGLVALQAGLTRGLGLYGDADEGLHAVVTFVVRQPRGVAQHDAVTL